MKWESKNLEKKEYKKGIGDTDYNIPIISYKSALFISFFILMIVLFVGPLISIFTDNKLIMVVVESVMIGFVVAYAQYYIQSNKGNTLSFYLVWLAFSIVSGYILYMFINYMIIV